MSISDKFKNFCNNIRISQDDKDKISNRYKEITKRLNRDFRDSDSETSHSLYVWSYWRDTDIYVSDIDILFQLPSLKYVQYNNYSWNWQSALLQEVKNSLQKRYSTTHIKWDGQIVEIKRDDDIIFEILPCFLNNSWTYLYPDTNDWGSWEITNPKAEIDAIKNMNDECNYNLKRLCRMVRAWRDNVWLKMWWLLVDTLCYNFLKNWKYKEESYTYYDRMVRDFFQYLSERDSDQEYRLAPWSWSKVYKKDNFVYKAKNAYKNILAAIEAEWNKYEYTANNRWKDVFWSKFI